MRHTVLSGTLALILIAMTPLAASGAAERSYQQQLTGLDTQQGLFDIHTSPARGTVLATLPAADTGGLIGRYIYAARLRSGLGSNPVGLDRGLGDGGQLIAFRRIGERVIVEAENLKFRAQSDNADERAAVTESFARSVLWSGKITSVAGDGRLLVDLGGFLTRDGLGIAAQLKYAGQGQFSLDSARSFVSGEQLAFPDNVELESVLTFASNAPGDEVIATTPDARSVSLTVHHSFVRLPDDGYRVRESDPRAAVIDIPYYDFSQPLSAALPRRLARRYRLQKTDPSLTVSEVVKPIVFYVDRGAPEPIRSALLEGAGWWAQAFEVAGFKGGYQVKLLPPDAHPLDIRYNVVQWVHRQTRGWSYGGGVSDPRTGEMLKGHVILGSQRVRQDRMIFEGLAGRAKTGSGEADDPLVLSLARIRQLAAHEVGHALGFAHNMAASADGRASVMDYPAPLVSVSDDGALDFSEVYATGMGAWDLFTVNWLYGEFAPGMPEQTALDALVDKAYTSGLRYVADQHARPVGAAHPRGSLWDNGADPVDALQQALAVREIALKNFGIDRLASGQAIADLRTVFAPIYLYHRYQTLAAAKMVGGIAFSYPRVGDGRVGDGDSAVKPVSGLEQQRALSALLKTVLPKTLRIHSPIQSLMMPSTDDAEPILGRERVESRIGPMFDPLQAAAGAAKLTFGALFHPARLGRVSIMHAQDETVPSVQSILSQTANTVFASGVDDSADVQVQAVTQWQFLSSLMQLQGDPLASIDVRADARQALEQAIERLTRSRTRLAQRPAQRSWMANAVREYLDTGELPESVTPKPTTVPPGSPIGASAGCWHCDSGALLR